MGGDTQMFRIESSGKLLSKPFKILSIVSDDDVVDVNSNSITLPSSAFENRHGSVLMGRTHLFLSGRLNVVAKVYLLALSHIMPFSTSVQHLDHPWLHRISLWRLHRCRGRYPAGEGASHVKMFETSDSPAASASNVRMLVARSVAENDCV